MGKDYRNENNRDKRFRGKKPDLSKKEGSKNKKGGHKGQPKFHPNFDEEPFNGGLDLNLGD